MGVEADCVQVGNSKFRYGYDSHIELGKDRLASYSEFLADACQHYDVFHFYYRPLFQFDSRRLIFPTGLDLLALRAAGKVVIFHYRGSEVRTAERFRELSPFHYVEENPDGLFDKFPESTVHAMRRYVQGVANAVLVPDPELQSYVPGSSIVARAVDLSVWEDMGVPDEDEPLIVHAPSRRTVKGTDHLLKAVADLQAEGLRFRFQLVENMPHEEARELYCEASVIVDQLRIGWYGVLAVEGMALGKATVAYIREDLLHHLPLDAPLACANPETIRDVLRELIVDKQKRVELGRKGREYCEEVHDADRIACQLLDLYERAAADPKPVSMNACLEYLRVQSRHTPGAYGNPSLLLPRQVGWARRQARRFLPYELRLGVTSAVRAFRRSPPGRRLSRR